MTAISVPLDRVPRRVLELLAHLISDLPVRVIVTDRIDDPLVVSAQCKSLCLHPHLAGLHDVLLGAALLRKQRALRRWGLTPEGAVNEPVPATIAARWVRAALAELYARFPGASRLDGVCGRRAPPRIVWRDVELRPLDEASATGDLQLSAAPGMGFTSKESDLEVILRAIAAGKVPLEHRPELPELPMVTLPLDLAVPSTAPEDRERLESELQAVEESAQRAARCMTDKSLGQLVVPSRRFLGRGATIDPSQLHRLRLAELTGERVRVFRDLNEQRLTRFDPERHLAVLGIALGSLAKDREGRSLSMWAARFITRAIELMGGDLVIVAYADQLMEAEGRRIYVQLPVLVKPVEDPLDSVAWSRLERALQLQKAAPGRPTTFHPFLVQDLGRRLTEAAEGGRYRTIDLHFLATAGLGLADVETPTFLARVAQDLDQELERLHASQPVRWGGIHYATKELISAASKGSLVADMAQL